MVFTPPTPSLRHSTDSLHSSHDGLSPTSKLSPARASSRSSLRAQKDGYDGLKAKSPASKMSALRDSREYDFEIDRIAARRLDVRGGVLFLVKGCLGCGIMSIHETYMACGLWTALPVNAALGLLLAYCMYNLTVSAQNLRDRMHVPSLSYPELAEAALECGPCGKFTNYGGIFRHIVESFICLNILGACAAYQVMMARQLKQLVDGTEGLGNAWPPVRGYIVIILLPCLFVSVFTSLHYLSPFSFILDIFIVLLCISTIGYSALSVSINPFTMPVFQSLDGLFELIGVAMFSMDGIVITLAVENSLRNPKIFPLVLVIGMSIVVSLVMVMGAFGYWGYGEKSTAPITINFPWGEFAIQLKMFLVIMTYVSFALSFWVPSNLVWYYASYYHDPARHWIWERVYRMLLIILTNIVAVLMLRVAVFMALIGTFCVSFLALIFPAIIALNVEWTDPGPGKFYWRVLRAVFMILLGLTLCGIGTYANIRELVLFFNV